MIEGMSREPMKLSNRRRGLGRHRWWFQPLGERLQVEATAACQLDRLRSRRLIMRQDDGYTVPGTAERGA